MGVLVGMGWGVEHKVEWITVRIGGVEAQSREERCECTGFVGGDSSIHGRLFGVPYGQAFSDIQCWAAICGPSMSSFSRHLKKPPVTLQGSTTWHILQYLVLQYSQVVFSWFV